MSADWLRIGDGELTVAINPLGAELSSIRDAQGREWMTDADPAFWTGRAPLLFPIVGRLNGDSYRLGGQSYAMKQHGFARRMMWEVVAHDAAGARLRLTDTDETLAAWPFPFVLEAEYRVTGRRVETVITLTNRGAEPMPASFGFHPGFAWPMPGEADKAGHHIAFDADEPGTLAALRDGLIAGHDRASPLTDGRMLALSDELFADDALVWDGLASRGVTYRGPGGASLRVEFPDADKLGIWTKPGAGFVCIEPWWGIADPVGFTGELTDKPGMMTIAPGAGRNFAMAFVIG